jgi:hypothetical protein
MADAEIGDYVVQANAWFVPDAGKWQPILCMTRLRGVPDVPISQSLNYLPALFESEAEAIEYGFIKGRALVKGELMGLTI